MHPSHPPHGLRILAVDDEASVRAVLTSCLEISGHSVETCAAAPEALERFHCGQNWDLVMTDRLMPGMSGAEFAAAIKRISAGTPVIMVTGSADPARPWPDPFIDAILPKPFTIAALQRALSSVTADRIDPDRGGRLSASLFN